MSAKWKGHLDYAGFSKLKPGRIHIFCPECHRKVSNVPREDEDPITAVLMQALCEDCNPGDFDSPTYFDANGQEVTPEPKP